MRLGREILGKDNRKYNPYGTSVIRAGNFSIIIPPLTGLILLKYFLLIIIQFLSIYIKIFLNSNQHLQISRVPVGTILL